MMRITTQDDNTMLGHFPWFSIIQQGLVGGIPTPLKNMKVKWDHHPNYWGTENSCSKPPKKNHGRHSKTRHEARAHLTEWSKKMVQAALMQRTMLALLKTGWFQRVKPRVKLAKAQKASTVGSHFGILTPFLG
jgi:hypothetical protein